MSECPNCGYTPSEAWVRWDGIGEQPPRPDVGGRVEWFQPVCPVDAREGDIWHDTPVSLY